MRVLQAELAQFEGGAGDVEIFFSAHGIMAALRVRAHACTSPYLLQRATKQCIG